MNARRPLLQRTGGLCGGLLIALVASFPLAGHAQRNLVLMTGINMTLPSERTQQMQEYACSPDVFEPALRAIDVIDARVRPQLESLGVDTDAIDDAMYDAEQMYGLNCANARTTTVELAAFRIIYAECRMTMHEGMAMVDLRMPRGGGQAIFDVVDYDGQQVLSQPIDVAGLLRAQLAQGTPQHSISAPGTATEFVTPHMRTTVREYTFNTKFTMDVTKMMQSFTGGAMAVTPDLSAMLGQLSGSPFIESSGTAWISNDVPGLDTVRAFYENFAAVIDSGQSQLMGGLFNHFLLAEGLPLSIEQTTKLTVAPMGMNMTLLNSTDNTLITSVRLLPMSAGYCEGSLIPEGFTVTEMPGAGDGSSQSATPGAGNDEMAAAMAELNAAMSNMTDEDRAAMQQLTGGMGQLLGGLFSGQGLPGTAPGAQQSAPPTSSAAPTRTGPSSADLASDNLTQMVQNYLQALGYDPGNTDGELDTETVIAISQFQAEKGLEVTGAVTPQLAGILAAEVDK